MIELERSLSAELAKPRMLFFSLQGLGDSLLNLPAFLNIRRKFKVEVICFRNGTSAFFQSFHDCTLGLASRAELLKLLPSLSADAIYFSYPTWKKELSAILLTSSPKKYFLRPPGLYASWLWPKVASGDTSLHFLENNLLLAQSICGGDDASLDLIGAFGLQSSSTSEGRTLCIHPTASSVYKYYPLSFWKELLNELASKFDQISVFCGANAVETGFCQDIKDVVGDRVGKKMTTFVGLPFDQLIQHLYCGSYFIGSDSSLMHLSALLDRPTLGLWSFANHREMYPYGQSSLVYMPQETLSAFHHGYPNAVPSYMKRASGQAVAAITQGLEKASFTIMPRFKNQAVQFFTY
jgi:ADP-heptose:LPS heptosyltransferase